MRIRRNARDSCIERIDASRLRRHSARHTPNPTSQLLRAFTRRSRAHRFAPPVMRSARPLASACCSATRESHFAQPRSMLNRSPRRSTAATSSNPLRRCFDENDAFTAATRRNAELANHRTNPRRKQRRCRWPSTPPTLSSTSTIRRVRNFQRAHADRTCITRRFRTTHLE